MDLLLKLPKTLQSKTNQDVPITVIERLNFLWSSCCNLAVNSPDLAHRMSKEFVILSNNFDIDLPDYIGSRICRYCCAIQVPAETCSFRIHKRSKSSRANRLSKEKLRNQIVVFCTLCKKSSVKLPAYNKSSHVIRPDFISQEQHDDNTNPRKRSLLDMKQQLSASSSSKGANQSSSNGSTAKFSFLNKQSSSTAVGIPRSSSSISFSNLNGGSAMGTARPAPVVGKLDSVDFISFGSTSGGNNKQSVTTNAVQQQKTNNNNLLMHKSNSTGSFSTMFNKNKPLVSSSLMTGTANKGGTASIGSMSSLLSSFNGGGLGAVATKPVASLNVVNLLDLEKSNKKKRKSLGK